MPPVGDTPSLIDAGVSDTAEVSPRKARGPEPPPPYRPCTTCGALVLHGHTATGAVVQLDTTGKAYVVLWANGEDAPVCQESRGYPVHRCGSAPGHE